MKREEIVKCGIKMEHAITVTREGILLEIWYKKRSIEDGAATWSRYEEIAMTSVT